MTAIGSRTIARSTWLRFLLLVAVVVGALAAARFTPVADWLTRERLLDSLDTFRDHPAAPLAFYGVFSLACAFGSPIVPLLVAGGAAFGVLKGATLGMASVLTAAAIDWLLVRRLGYAFLQELVGDRLKRVERLLARRGFWSLVRLRFVPIPYFVTNTCLTLLGVSLGTFLVSTAVAMVPVTLAWSAFASALVETAEGARGAAVRNLGAIMVLLVALSFVPPRIIAWRRARRLQDLRARRAGRSLSGEG